MYKYTVSTGEGALYRGDTLDRQTAHERIEALVGSDTAAIGVLMDGVGVPVASCTCTAGPRDAHYLEWLPSCLPGGQHPIDLLQGFVLETMRFSVDGPSPRGPAAIHLIALNGVLIVDTLRSSREAHAAISADSLEVAVKALDTLSDLIEAGAPAAELDRLRSACIVLLEAHRDVDRLVRRGS